MSLAIALRPAVVLNPFIALPNVFGRNFALLVELLEKAIFLAFNNPVVQPLLQPPIRVAADNLGVPADACAYFLSLPVPFLSVDVFQLCSATIPGLQILTGTCRLCGFIVDFCAFSCYIFVHKMDLISGIEIMPFIRNTSDRRAAMACIKDLLAGALLAREENNLAVYADHLVDAKLALMDFNISLGKSDNPERRILLEKSRRFHRVSDLPALDDDAVFVRRQIECKENMMRIGFELEMINCISYDKDSPFHQI